MQLVATVIFFLGIGADAALTKGEAPNIVILLADDFGIGDLGCYGNTTIRTPNIDRLAKEGVRLEHHVAAAALCTPSRAALLTGRYPARYGFVGEDGTPPVVTMVASRVGLPLSEVTIAEALRTAGYTTGAVGKWHLGSGCKTFGRNCDGALNYGFSHFYGMLTTLSSFLWGDSTFWIFNLSLWFYQTWLATFIITTLTVIFVGWKKYYKICVAIALLSLLIFPLSWVFYSHYYVVGTYWWGVSKWMNQNLNFVIMRNGKVVYQRPDLDTLMEETANESVQFISNHSRDSAPFFLYHSFYHTHIPMFTAPRNTNRSCCGRYGDNIEEMDDGVGIILKALEDNGIENNTIVYFASDHGGAIDVVDPYDGQRIGGYNKLFKGGKGMGAAEGGIRIPGIFRWPRVIPEGETLDYPTSLLDIFPTILQLVGLPPVNDIMPNSNPLDGISFAAKLKNPKEKLDEEDRVLIHHCEKAIHGLRLITDGKVYKMYLFIHKWGKNSTHCGWTRTDLSKCKCYGDTVTDVSKSPILYELVSDRYEDFPVSNSSKEYEEVVAKLQNFLTEWRKNTPYPPSLFGSIYDNILLPWLQPTIYFNS